MKIQNKMFFNQSDALADDYNETHHTHHNSLTETAQIVTYFIGIPICLAAILLDILLIFVFFKYPALKTRSNYYILHYAICNIIYLLSDYVLYFTMVIFFEGFLLIGWYCSLIQVEHYFLNMCLLFVSGYTLDEYFILSSSEYFLYMYKNGFKYIIACIYPIHFIFAFIVSTVCFDSTSTIKFDLGFIIVTIVYVFLLVTMLKIKYDSVKYPNKNNPQLVVALKITLTLMLLFLPKILYYNILNILEPRIPKKSYNVLLILDFIPEYLALSSSFVVAYLLFKLNKFYRLAFFRVFCSNRKGMDYSRLDVLPEMDINTN